MAQALQEVEEEQHQHERSVRRDEIVRDDIAQDSRGILGHEE